jgi:hypothetical protein
MKHEARSHTGTYSMKNCFVQLRYFRLGDFALKTTVNPGEYILKLN